MFAYTGPLTIFGITLTSDQILIAIGVLSVVLLPFLLIFIRRLIKKGKFGLAEAEKGKHLASAERAKADIIIASIEDGVVSVDKNNVVQVFNTAAANITGWSAKDTIGLDYHAIFKLLGPKGQPYDSTQDPFTKCFQSGAPVRDTKSVLQTRNNLQIPLNISVSPLFNLQKEVDGVVAIFRDVSQERREEQQRAEFISTASHEMRTPVAAIEGYLALALNPKVSNLDAKARGYLEKAHSSTQHLGKLFQDLLTSAKAEDGRLVSHPVVVEMGALLEQVTDSLKFSAEKKGLQVEYILGTDASAGGTTTNGGRNIQPLYYVQTDPDRMREVITNLFDNAVKYTEKGKITIGLTGNDAVVQLYIQDTGAGIPTEDIPHLFQKFYRVDNSSTRTIGGTGLGLFICRKIIELYNGRIWVESQSNQGSTFYINLPRLTSTKASELQAKEQRDPLASSNLTTPVNT